MSADGIAEGEGMEETDHTREVEQLLDRVNEGDLTARDELVERIQHELRGIARKALAGERERDAVLQTTVLVNEAYVKLFERGPTSWKNRRHFFGAAKRAMRQLLVDWARERKGQKRGGGERAVTLGEWIPQASGDVVEIFALDEALEKLAKLDARQADVVEYKCLLGLGNAEIAEILDVSLRTVVDDWKHAKAWLQVQLGAGDRGAS